MAFSLSFFVVVIIPWCLDSLVPIKKQEEEDNQVYFNLDFFLFFFGRECFGKV